MAAHYCAAVLPGRVRKPKDTEGALGISKGAYRGIEELAALSSNEGYKPSGNRFERS